MKGLPNVCFAKSSRKTSLCTVKTIFKNIVVTASARETGLEIERVKGPFELRIAFRKN